MKNQERRTGVLPLACGLQHSSFAHRTRPRDPTMKYQKPVLHDFFPGEAAGSDCYTGSHASGVCSYGNSPNCNEGYSASGDCASWGSSASQSCNGGSAQRPGYDCSYGTQPNNRACGYGYSTGPCAEGGAASGPCSYGGGDIYCGGGHYAMQGCSSGDLPT